MNFKKLLSDQLNLLLSDPNYIIPEQTEIYIEDQSGIYRNYCTDTEQYLDTQLDWIKFITS